MVNAKNVAFKVNKQTPTSQAPAQAYGTVINCRKPGGKRSAREQKEVRSHYVTLANIDGTLKRKWDGDWDVGPDGAAAIAWISENNATSTLTIAPDRPVHVQKWHPPKPPRLRKLKGPSNGVDLDCWFIILSFSDPAQLLLMHGKIPSCYYFLRDNPTLWKHSRNYHYGSDLPEPPSELTEFQYADLRHKHGCMSCPSSPNTRKTYWAFLRRWCKSCLQDKTLKEHDAMVMLRDPSGEDTTFLQKCLPSGIFDSWGNFVGVGPATTHALKTVYLIRDVKELLADYLALKARNKQPLAWEEELHAWMLPKMELVEERKAFAHKMEAWEETLRTDRTYDYSAKKAARKIFFQKKAFELDPPITAREIECCPSYKRAIVIPKDPNNTSWQQLKPKLEKEAAELREKGGPPEDRSHAPSMSGTSTPNSVTESQQPNMFPMLGLNLQIGVHHRFPTHRHTYPGTGSAQSHPHSGSLPPLSHMHPGPSARPNHILPPLHTHTHTAPPPTQNYDLSGPPPTPNYGLGGPQSTQNYTGLPLAVHTHSGSSQQNPHNRPTHSYNHFHPLLPPPHSHMF